MSKRINELEKYIENLSKEEQAKQQSKTKDNPEKLFGLIKQGDTVGVAVAIKNNIDIQMKDKNGMTALHLASAHGTELISDLLINQADGSVWQRDKFDRLPLDVARENGHEKIGDKLEQVTYPELFKEDKDNHQMIAKHLEKQKEIGRQNTAPPYAKDLDTREMMMRFRNKRNERDDLEH